MNLTFGMLTFCIVYSGVLTTKKVKIVQEPAYYGGMQAQQQNYVPKGNNMLRPFRNPQNFSGPKHLHVLYGKCFSLIENSYLYQLCPFQNITQIEQTWRWNAFQGILGPYSIASPLNCLVVEVRYRQVCLHIPLIWKEWSIVNNTLEGMVMTEGDPCPGGIRRQSKIFFKCANKNKLVTVKEPKTCQYEVEFQTPLACPVDAFLVYPLLSRNLQNEWEEIEKGYYFKELTEQGYQKLRLKLFTRAGLLIPDGQDDGRKKESSSLHERFKDIPSTVSSGFKSKDECSKAYADLLRRYEKLVREHRKQNSSFEHRQSKESQISNLPSLDLRRARGDHGTVS